MMIDPLESLIRAQVRARGNGRVVMAGDDIPKFESGSEFCDYSCIAHRGSPAGPASVRYSSLCARRSI
jgi:hypothetical protein